jgi:hypothetical protein
MKKEKDNISWYHWLWMIPMAIAISPIGTGLAVALLNLDFFGVLTCIGIQIFCFFLVGILSNFGE